MRLDLFVSKKFDISRQKTQEMIKQGLVFCNQIQVTKPSHQVSQEDEIVLKEKPRFVSRAGEKLFGFLKGENFSYKVVLDVGSSTGGFAQVLLLLGVDEVHCVDVGKNQLSPLLRNDKRIKIFEECDIRHFIKQRDYDLLTCDVSFISIEKIFGILKTMSKEMILLFKPQFEVGKEVKRNKKGVVVDNELINIALKSFQNYLLEQGFLILRTQKSVLKGKEGNEEYFFHVRSKY
ncbi:MULTISPECIES: 23S rRNA (cytidine-2'-O)-methyltransferase TlyA [unclassified Helicobacter]|uniref:23S rRNA (cytidine-2'-O)-methyltransferase TlyA n=1 Tax=unclassified Helicobacter TaxID=2593540 RepID=UPI000CF11982|nr:MULTISPECIES: TlyA family RNA methyltransferase [unclassified Helicobacter]